MSNSNVFFQCGRCDRWISSASLGDKWTSLVTCPLLWQWIELVFQVWRGESIKIFLLRLVRIGMSHFYICIIYLIKQDEISKFAWLRINWNMSLDTSLLKSAAESKLIHCMGSVSMLLMVCLHTCLHTHSRPWNWSSQMPRMYFDIQGKCPCN